MPIRHCNSSVQNFNAESSCLNILIILYISHPNQLQIDEDNLIRDLGALRTPNSIISPPINRGGVDIQVHTFFPLKEYLQILFWVLSQQTLALPFFWNLMKLYQSPTVAKSSEALLDFRQPSCNYTSCNLEVIHWNFKSDLYNFELILLQPTRMIVLLTNKSWNMTYLYTFWRESIGIVLHYILNYT